MKKPIDPNLGDALDEELLTGEPAEEIKKEEFGFNDYSTPAPEPKFDVKDKETGESIDPNEKAVPAAMDPDDDEHHHHHHHHHHHSSGSSHHSSGSSHHSSGGSHHSSGSSHHSSGSSHRHHHHHHHHKKEKQKLPVPARVAIGFLIAIFIFVAVGLGTFLALMINGNKDVKGGEPDSVYGY